MKAFMVDADWAPKPGYVPNQREIDDRRAYKSNLVWKNVVGSVVDVPMPQIKPNEVLVKIGACGVCGTDAHIIEMDKDGYMVFPGHSKFPEIIGHEFSGEIVEIGSKVKLVKPGDVIAIIPMQGCGKCYSCMNNFPNQCLDVQKAGICSPGGFAEYIAVEEQFCCPINDMVDLYGDKLTAMEVAAMAEPACVSYNGIIIHGGGVRAGVNTAVFGAGPIGLCSINLARAFGASNIIVFDMVDKRLDLAKKMGATHVFNSGKLAAEESSPSQKIKELTGGLGAGLIVEATGAGTPIYNDIMSSLALGAKIIQIGMTSKPTSVDMTILQARVSSIHGTQGNAGNEVWPSVLRLLAAGRMDLRPMAGGRYYIEDTELAIEKSTSTAGKILISQHYKK